MSGMLQIKNLACWRDERLLFSNLNFEVNSGDVLHITGSNGCGKTTLLRMLLGLRELDLDELDDGGAESGEPLASIIYNDQAINTSREALNNYYGEIAYLGHQSAVKAQLSVYENIAFWVRIHGVTTASGNANSKIVNSVIDKLGLHAHRDLPAQQLSAGLQRRVGLARLLLRPYKIWLLDEPFTALDRDSCELVQQMIVQQAQGTLFNELDDVGVAANASKGCVILTSHQAITLPSCEIRVLQLAA